MRLRCPRCDDVFNAKANARTIRCPSCGFRQSAPEGGAPAFPTSRKAGEETFTREGTPAAAAGSGMGMWVAIGVVVLLALGVVGYLMWGHGGSGSGSGTGTTTSTGNQTTGNPRVLIHTSAGDMQAEIFSDKAPLTAENFLTYVREGFYTNLHIYRIVPGFVNQGGGEGDQKAPTHPAIRDEAKVSGLHNTKYTLAMARTNDADSAQAEFFINEADNAALDPGGANGPDGYAVFGRLVSGFDVSDRINQMQAPPGPTFTITLLDDGSSGASTSTSSAPTCQASGKAEAGLITPGVWNVSAATDYEYVWVHNLGGTPLSYTWSATGPNGTSLPSGWTVTFDQGNGCLQPNRGTTGSAGTDWAGTLATVTVPAGTAGGDVAAELHVGGAVAPFTLHVNDLSAVSKVGDSITTCYDLYGQAGNRIQAGKFPLQVGPGGAVPGYGYGTAGLRVGETVKLVVPPPFAYGASGQPGSGIKPWETLTWYASNVSADTTCPTFNG